MVAYTSNLSTEEDEAEGYELEAYTHLSKTNKLPFPSSKQNNFMLMVPILSKVSQHFSFFSTYTGHPFTLVSLLWVFCSMMGSL